MVKILESQNGRQISARLLPPGRGFLAPLKIKGAKMALISFFFMRSRNDFGPLRQLFNYGKRN